MTDKTHEENVFSTRFPERAATCTKCNQGPGRRCMTPRGRRLTVAHDARKLAYEQSRIEAMITPQLMRSLVLLFKRLPTDKFSRSISVHRAMAELDAMLVERAPHALPGVVDEYADLDAVCMHAGNGLASLVEALAARAWFCRVVGLETGMMSDQENS